MSHYFYENAFDWIDSSGDFGYSIEQDQNIQSNSGIDVSAHNYIIEVHYLGNASTSLYLDVNNIDTGILYDVEYVSKSFSQGMRTDAIQESELVITEIGGNAVNNTDNMVKETYELIAEGKTSYSGQQATLDPGFGLIEIKIPTATTEAEQNAANQTYRPHDYLFLETGLYFDIIQGNSALVTKLQDVIDDTSPFTSTALEDFASAVNAEFSVTSGLPSTYIDATTERVFSGFSDASNDITDQTGLYHIDYAPGMIRFDNINYFGYDDFLSPTLLNTGNAVSPSETSLIGEFRITENTSDAWNFNANFDIELSTNTSTYYYDNVQDIYQTDINGQFKNTSGSDINFLSVDTNISRDASGNLSFSETVPVINTLTDSSSITFSTNATYGGTSIDAGTYSISYDTYSSPNIYLQGLEDNDGDGYFSHSNTYKSMYGSDMDLLISDINGGSMQIGTVPQMVFDGLGNTWNGVNLTSSNLRYDDAGTASTDYIPTGEYLVTKNSPNDVTFTPIGNDTDFDNIKELSDSVNYKLFVGQFGDSSYSYEVNEVENFAYNINSYGSYGVTTNNYIQNTDYETSDRVIPIMDELGTTWNTVSISSSYMDINNTPVPHDEYKVSLNSDTGGVILHKTFMNNGVPDIVKNVTPIELNPSSSATFTSDINSKMSGLTVTQVDYKQYFYDLINTDPVDAAEIIPAIDEHVALEGGTKYVDGVAFDNTGINSINTADVSSITSVDAGDETDFIAGGVGGFTIDGGSGMDMYFATPGSVDIVEDQDGNIISERGVTVDLSANRVIYLKDGTEDVVSNIEYFMGTLGDDLFVGSALHSTDINSNYTAAIQAFNPTAGKDEIFGAKDIYDPDNGNLLEVLTAVDYDAMQGGQGVIFILDGSDAATHAAVGSDELSFTKISEFAGDYWDATSWAGDGWLPSNDDILDSNGNFSTQSRYEASADGATLILDSFGDTDLAFDVDHYIGSSETDIFFGSNGNDSFDAGSGAGNFMSGGAGLDQLLVVDLNDPVSDGSNGAIEDGENLNLNSMEIDRVTDTHLQNVVVDTGGASSKLVSGGSQASSDNTLYRIDFADVQDLSTFYAANISSSLYNVSSSYELYLSSSLSDIGSAINGYSGVQYVTAHNKIDVDGNDLSILSSLSGQGHLILQETSVRVGEYIVKGTDNDGNDYNTVIKDVEQVVLTDDDLSYFGTGKISGAQEDIYQLIQGGQGDLGEMLYVTTGQTIDNATGASNYSGGLNFNNSDIFYSGHHTDFDRNSSRDGWAASVGSAFTAAEAKVWNDEVAQFFVWYDADSTDTIEGYEIAVKYQNGDINAWGIDNRQFDTFQNVTVDQSLADAIKAQFGDSLSVELGEYRVLYEAAYTDIETIVNSNADVTKWNFDFQPTSSRSTFYIQVGGGETGLNGSAGISDTLVTNIKVERVEDGSGFKWNINPQAEILVNLPILSGDANDNVMISGDSAETIEAGKGSDVMMGQGGSDNYKISAGDTRDANGDEVVGSFGVAGDVINEIGGSSDDKSDAITLSSAKSIDELSFSRTQIASEYWDNTLKIDVKYDSGAEDTLYVFDHYNQNLSSRAVEQLFLDDGWDSSEIWNLIVGDVNLATGIDEYTGTSGQDILIAGTTKSSLYGGDGQDILIGDQRGKETIFELGNRDGAWDQVADIIEGFGTGDHLDLSALGISDETEIKIDNNQLQLSDNTVIAEFSNFNDEITLDQLLTEDGTILYASSAA